MLAMRIRAEFRKEGDRGAGSERRDRLVRTLAAQRLKEVLPQHRLTGRRQAVHIDCKVHVCGTDDHHLRHRRF